MSVIKNAVIESVSIRIERGFILDSWVMLDYGGSGQGFGGFALYLGQSSDHHTVESFAGHFIYRCMEIAGVEDWDKMKDRAVRVRLDKEFGSIESIGHIVKDDWFNPAADFETVKVKVTA